jgi:hypothetical protein
MTLARMHAGWNNQLVFRRICGRPRIGRWTGVLLGQARHRQALRDRILFE